MSNSDIPNDDYYIYDDYEYTDLDHWHPSWCTREPNEDGYHFEHTSVDFVVDPRWPSGAHITFELNRLCPPGPRLTFVSMVLTPDYGEEEVSCVLTLAQVREARRVLAELLLAADPTDF